MTNPGSQVVTRRAERGSLLSRLRSYLFFAPMIYMYTGVMGTLSLLSSLSDREGRIQHWFAHTWARMILKTVMIRVWVEGLEHIDPAQTAIYAANHLSALDIPVLYAWLPVQFRIMAKKELFRYPFLGWHLKRSGQIPIDPGNARASLRSLTHASESLRHGTPLVVFPEGGRSLTGQLQEFMGGASYVAIRAQAPIVPIAIVGTDGALPMNSFHLLPGKVEMIIGEPISTTRLRVRDMDKLTTQVRQAIAEMYYSRSKGGAFNANGWRSQGPAAADDKLRTPAGRTDMKPRIAIPTPNSTRPDYVARALPQYERAVRAAGGEPVVIAASASNAEIAQAVKSCDGVLLPGSPADVDPEKYGAQRHPDTAPSDAFRDNADELLLQDAYNMRKPVFATCYGLQSLNVWRTGTLDQKLPAGIKHDAGSRVAQAHRVQLNPQSKLAALLRDAGALPAGNELAMPVNSSHHQAPETLGDGLRLVAWCPEDGVKEAVEGTAPDQFVLAVQWHPERTYDSDKASRALFRAFVQAAADWHKKLANKQQDFESVPRKR